MQPRKRGVGIPISLPDILQARKIAARKIAARKIAAQKNCQKKNPTSDPDFRKKNVEIFSVPPFYWTLHAICARKTHSKE